MAAIIEGFEYDIFISYRQNDNKYDGWVTDFVQNLRKELRATLKEEVSVYFDENPHDGLLEIHHVDDSLKNKIKSLIFIPILSQTYCDSKSFAWRNEFIPFIEMASRDRFGLSVKLQSNGNVVNRVLPVRIHDLDPDDKALFESTIGSSLRSINFIFKAPGVNRPLRANEDRPQDNLDKTYYRDQINKVANLAKEIVLSLKTKGEVNVPSVKVNTDKNEVIGEKRKSRTKVIASILFLVVVSILLYLILDRTARDSVSSRTKVSLAVLPFNTIDNENESQYFADGVMDVILSNLSAFPELSVKPVSAVEKYRESKQSLSEISEDLNVQYILEGSAWKVGGDVRIIVRLVDASKEANIWSETYQSKFINLFDVQNQISESIAKELKAKLTPDINSKINRKPTADFEAYDLFLRAKQLSRKYETSQNINDLNLAIQLLKQAIARDNQFAMAYAWLAGLKALQGAGDFNNSQLRDSIILLANKALHIDSTLVEPYILLAKVNDYLLDNVKVLQYTYKALEEREGDTLYSAELIECLASVYSRIGEVDKAIYLYDKLLKISPYPLEVLHLKFFPLAAGGKVNELNELDKEVNILLTDTAFQLLIKTHIYAEQGNFAGLVNLYDRWRMTDEELNLLDQYTLFYAYALRKSGKEDEANELIEEFENVIPAEYDFLRAQLYLFKGNKKQALQLLNNLNIGWYNLSMCAINPLFEEVSNEASYIQFINNNTERVMNERERVILHERNGFLPNPVVFFDGRTNE